MITVEMKDLYPTPPPPPKEVVIRMSLGEARDLHQHLRTFTIYDTKAAETVERIIRALNGANIHIA